MVISITFIIKFSDDVGHDIFVHTMCSWDFCHLLVPYDRESHWNAYVGAGVTWVRTIILPFLIFFLLKITLKSPSRK